MVEAPDRARMAEMFKEGYVRKMEERELFALRSIEDPSRRDLYSLLIDYLEVDMRYYTMAACYYSDDYTPLEHGTEEDLLLLTAVSELPPRDYAAYLREIDPSARPAEKATHEALKAIKKSIRAQLGLK
jgi:hypothetical protein